MCKRGLVAAKMVEAWAFRPAKRPHHKGAFSPGFHELVSREGELIRPTEDAPALTPPSKRCYCPTPVLKTRGD